MSIISADELDALYAERDKLKNLLVDLVDTEPYTSWSDSCGYCVSQGGEDHVWLGTPHSPECPWLAALRYARPDILAIGS